MGAADDMNQPVAVASDAGEPTAPGLNPAVCEQDASLESLQSTDPVDGPGAPILPVAFQASVSSAEGLVAPNDLQIFRIYHDSQNPMRVVGIYGKLVLIFIHRQNSMVAC